MSNVQENTDQEMSVTKEISELSEGSEHAETGFRKPALLALAVLQALLPGAVYTKTPLHSPIFAIGTGQA